MYSGGLEAAAGGSTLPARAGAPTGPRPSDTRDAVAAYSPSDVVRSLRPAQSEGLSKENLERATAAARWQGRYTAALLSIDLLAAGAASATGYLAGFGSVAPPGATRLAEAVLLPLAWLAAVGGNGGYQVRFVASGNDVFTRPALAFAQLAVVLAFAELLVSGRSGGFALITLASAAGLCLTGRAAARAWLIGQRASGRALVPVLAVGTAVSVQQLAAGMRADRNAGFSVVGAVLPAPEAGDPAVRRRLAEAGIAVTGDLDAVPSSIEQCNARSVAVLAGDLDGDDLRRVATQVANNGADLIVSTGLAEVGAPRVRVGQIAGAPLLRVDNPHRGGFRRLVKGALDRTAAVLGLMLIAPMMILLALLVRGTSRGPAFFLQTRVGRNGKPFRMVKFRSMYADAEARLADLIDLNENDGLKFKMRNDPRVTPVGRVLRRFSLDELPQLFNVMIGSMSLVGPRPPLPAEVACYEEETKRRLLVKPGLTGLWQVSGRSDLSWQESVMLDLHYVENWSLSMDMVVLLKTAKVVVRATGAY